MADDLARVRLDLTLDYDQRFAELAWTLRTSKAALARKLVMEFIDTQSPLPAPVPPSAPAQSEKKAKSGRKSGQSS